MSRIRVPAQTQTHIHLQERKILRVVYKKLAPLPFPSDHRSDCWLGSADLERYTDKALRAINEEVERGTITPPAR